MANFSFLLPVLALSLSAVFAAYASSTLQDFCVTNPIGQGIVSKYICIYVPLINNNNLILILLFKSKIS